MRSRTWTFQRTNYWTPKIQSKMAEILHLENRHDVIFFCWGWSDLDKISQTAVIWSKSKPDVEFQYWIWQTFGRIPWHVIPHSHMPHCRVQSPGEINVMIVPRCIRHIENRFSPYYILFVFVFNAVWSFFDERRLSYRLQYTCFLC